MVSAVDVILEYVCPILGITMANIMFGAPIRAVQEAVARGYLGDLNPTPWAFMTGNCLGWVAYSFLINNVFVLFGNAPGLLLSVWLNLCAAKLQYQGHKAKEMRESFVSFLKQNTASSSSSDLVVKEETEVEAAANDRNTPVKQQQHRAPWNNRTDLAKLVLEVTTQQAPAPAPHEKIVVGITTIWMAVFAFISFTDVSQSAKELVVGIIVNINLLFFYGAPLSTIYKVLQTQSTASIHFWTMITNTANGVFWTAYGLALLDPILIVPNGIGVALGLVQFVLYAIFPNKKSKDDGVKDAEAEPPTDQEEGKTEPSN